MQSIKNTAKLLVLPRMVMTLPLQMWCGVSMSMFGGIFIPLMTRSMADHHDYDDDKNRQNTAALYAMCLLGAGEIIGGQIIGSIRDRIGNNSAIVALLVLTVIALVVVTILNHNNTFNYMAYLMCFTWGLQDSGLNTIINCILGFEFESNITPFSIFKFVQSIAIFVTQIIGG